MKCKIAGVVLVIALCFGKSGAIAQNIQYNLFDAMPLILNPSYTGMIEGKVRGNIIYRNAWKSIATPYTSFGVSFDGPVMTLRNGDYFGAGILVMRDNAADGNLKNSLGVASVSYHKLLGSDSGWFKGHGCDLAFGLQGGYAESRIDYSKLYFNSVWLPPGGGTYTLGTSNEVNYYMLNAGISFSQAVSKRFNYTIGLKVGNINQPNDVLLKKQSEAAGFDRRYVTTAGANIGVFKGFSLRPAVVYINSTTASEIIAGNEFQYAEKGRRGRTAQVFCGLWYRTSDAVMATVGVSTGIIRIAIAYDYSVSTLNSVSNGNGGFEVAIGFNSPGKTRRERHVPCNRF